MRGFGTGPRGCGKEVERQGQGYPSGFSRVDCEGNVLTPLAGPVQKRSNHTGKEVEKRGAIWQAFPRPLLVEMGQDSGRGLSHHGPGCDCTPLCLAFPTMTCLPPVADHGDKVLGKQHSAPSPSPQPREGFLDASTARTAVSTREYTQYSFQLQDETTLDVGGGVDLTR